MKVNDVMHTRFCTIRGQVSLSKAEEVMNQQEVGVMPVRRGGKVVGMLSRLDLLDGLLQKRYHGTVTVKDVMRRELPCCYPKDSLEKVAQYMRKRNKRYLLVISRDYQLRGIISRTDVQAGLSGECEDRSMEDNGFKEDVR